MNPGKSGTMPVAKYADALGSGGTLRGQAQEVSAPMRDQSIPSTTEETTEYVRKNDPCVEVPLSQGLVALVDEADAEKVLRYKWYAERSGRKKNHYYAARKLPRKEGRQKTVQMHRFIVGAPAGMRVDHIDGNGLNNRRSNLRLATNVENGRNRRGPNANSTTGYLGVHLEKRNGKYMAHIGVDGRVKRLGSFDTAQGAAIARDKAAREIFGAFATLNFPEEGQ